MHAAPVLLDSRGIAGLPVTSVFRALMVVSMGVQRGGTIQTWGLRGVGW